LRTITLQTYICGVSYDKLNKPIEYLKGVGPQRGDALKKHLEIFCYQDLITYYPFRYVDRSKFYKIKDIVPDMPFVQIIGRLTSIETIGQKHTQRLVAKFTDGDETIDLVWFKGVTWIKKSLAIGPEYIVFGKPTEFNQRVNIAHPEIELNTPANRTLNTALQPFYNSSEALKTRGLDTKGILKLQQTVLDELKGSIPENLPNDIVQKAKLIGHDVALEAIHFPPSADLLNKARYRLKFEELFYNQLKLLKAKANNKKYYEGFVFEKVGEHFNTFFKEYLPFELKREKKRVMKEIRADLGSRRQMNRLLQGDVGSGKTLVALLSMLIAIDNGYQACIMAPTEILAGQHYQTLKDMLKDMDLNIALLTGSTKKAQRDIIHKSLEDGSLHILIGTHALIEDKVQFKNLGIVVIDEQHRFGVQQRARLWKKNDRPPHILIMSATPIPRTLAMTLYGDLDVSVIDELPPGRKAISTAHRFESSRITVFGFIREQIALGRQIYIVYPLIEESEKSDLKNLYEGYDVICREFPQPNYRVSIVHGKQKPAEKDAEMQRFVRGETQIMVATTVIEVGVNVPNASVMIIENAERFGLSQLHQLRGRVGRGADQSYCILMTDYKLSADAKVRLETMVRTTDGFEISEVDLKLRGPGDMSGTRQSGSEDFKLVNLVEDQKILAYVRGLIIDLLEKEEIDNNPKYRMLNDYSAFCQRSAGVWSRIS
jgi:ATP-dependent DNA helicase RecG